jgi:hypothetical protein
MPLWLRLTLIWLIAATVPLKGLAAVSMIGCAPVHHAIAGTVAGMVGHAHDHARDHDHAQANAHEVGHAPQVPYASTEPGAGIESAAADAAPSAGDLLTAKCSGCSPCCAAAAPAAEPPTVLPTQPAACGVPFVGAQHAGVVTDVPHRPPRPTRA